jgi:uncharacterized membrane protein YqhA
MIYPRRRVNTRDEFEDDLILLSFDAGKIVVVKYNVLSNSLDLLKAFMHQSQVGIEHQSNTQMAWMVGIHFTLILSGVLFAVMDKISESSHH